MPHKAAAARACHRLSPVAERLGVVNTVTNLGGYLVGDSTDGPGFLDALTRPGVGAERQALPRPRRRRGGPRRGPGAG